MKPKWTYPVSHEDYQMAKDIYDLEIDAWRRSERFKPAPKKPVRPAGRPPAEDKTQRVDPPAARAAVPLRATFSVSLDVSICNAIEKLRGTDTSRSECIRQLLLVALGPLVKEEAQ